MEVAEKFNVPPGLIATRCSVVIIVSTSVLKILFAQIMWQRNCTDRWCTTRCRSFTEDPITLSIFQLDPTWMPEILKVPRAWPITWKNWWWTMSSTWVISDGKGNTLLTRGRVIGVGCARCWETRTRKAKFIQIFLLGGRGLSRTQRASYRLHHLSLRNRTRRQWYAPWVTKVPTEMSFPVFDFFFNAFSSNTYSFYC